MALTVIAAYDVSEDRRRARLAALLQTFRDRVQYSVFLLTIDDQDLIELESRGLGLIDPAEDSLYLFRQCASCWESVQCLGQAMPPIQELFWAAPVTRLVCGPDLAHGSGICVCPATRGDDAFRLSWASPRCSVRRECARR